MSLYPLKFEPRYLEKMWGGRRIESVLGKTLPSQKPIGESWELYDFPPGVIDKSAEWVSSKIANGPLAGRTLHQLVAEYGPALYGDVPLVGPHGQFPILIKFLDAEQDLSVQVHPDAKYAAAHPGAHLKSEAWYIVHAEPAARLLKGLRPGVTRESFKSSLENGAVEQAIQSVRVKPGQCFYLESGTVHALGAGILAAEVQTPSDTTYRVYDFDRVDPSTGRKRDLHVEQALQCIAFEQGTAPEKQPWRSHVASFFTTVTSLVDSPYFKIEKVRFSEGVQQEIPYDQPVVWMILDGQVQIRVSDSRQSTTAGRGETLLLPARMKSPVLHTLADSVWLEITFPARSSHGTAL